MVGKAGFVLHNWLVRVIPEMQIAWERGEIGLANVLRCLPKEVQGRPYPKGQDKEQAEALCRQYDSWPANVHTVVLFGEYSQRLYFGEELHAEDVTDRSLGHDTKGVAGRMGRCYQKAGKRWIFAPHPAWILRQPSLVEHGQVCLKIAANTDKPVHVDYVRWDEAMGALGAY